MKTKSAREKRVGVCLVSSHPLFLTQFHEKLLNSGFQLQASKIAVPESAELLPKTDVYVVDSLVHPPLTGELVGSILVRNPKAAILVMAESFAEAAAFSLLQLGVKGILQYSDAEQQLPRALQAIAIGGFWVPRAILGRMLEHVLNSDRRTRRGLPLHRSISPREREILDCLLKNLSNKEIATKLNISERTVKFHVSNLLSKYGVQRRADLVLLSYQNASAGVLH